MGRERFGGGRSPLGRIRAWLARRRSGRQLEDLKSSASRASPSFKPQFQLRAAQLAAAMDRHDEALSLYGEAIDGYLEGGRSRAVEAVCRQVIEEYPQVVRARRTLALLALGRDDIEEATRLLREYVATSRSTGDMEILKKSLRMFAVITDSDEFRAATMAELERLGDGSATGAQGRSRAGDRSPFEAELGPWSNVTKAALLGPKGLRDLPI